jgi:hypothetical protein
MASRAWMGPFAASVVLASVGVLVPPTGASAGIYHVYSCRTPNGQSAPVDGWSASTTSVQVLAEDTCGQPGGGLLAAVPAGASTTEVDATAAWRLSPPAGARLVGATLWRAGYAAGFGHSTSDEYWIGGAGRQQAFDECVHSAGCTTARGNLSLPLAPENVVVAPPADVGEGLYFGAACVKVGELVAWSCWPEAAYGALVVVYAADLAIEQPAGPAVTDVAGALASASPVTGLNSVTFTASDPGAGVFEALVSVDGALLERVRLGDNGGRCVDAGGTADGSAAFLYLQPCVASASTSVTLDTAALSNGEHRLDVSVIDAAGNAATVLDRTILVANPAQCGSGIAPNAPAAGGAVLTASWEGTSSKAITGGFARAHTIAGRLTSATGAPIANALVELGAAPDPTGAAPASAAGASSVLARTGPDGRFTVGVPGAGPSRRLCLTLRDASGVGVLLATSALQLNVRAPVALRISPRTVRVGETISFSGRLGGGDVPPGGKALVLEARSAGSGWLQFKLVRSDARGRFHARYRFRFPGPARYAFRVLCEAEADYPFAKGFSNVVRVRER